MNETIEQTETELAEVGAVAIPFEVAERIVIERMKEEVRKHNLAWLESLSLEVKRGLTPEPDEVNYILWIGNEYRGINPNLDAALAAGIETAEQKRTKAIQKAKKKITEAQAELATLELAKLTAETKSEGAD